MKNLECTPYREIVYTIRNSIILPPFVYFMGIASTHFIKYYVAIMIKLWSYLEIGLILQRKSCSQIEKGQGETKE